MQGPQKEVQGPCARASGFSKTLIEALAPNYTVYHFCIKTKDMALAYIRGPCNSFCGPCTGPCPRKMSSFGRLSGTKYLLHLNLHMIQFFITNFLFAAVEVAAVTTLQFQALIPVRQTRS